MALSALGFLIIVGLLRFIILIFVAKSLPSLEGGGVDCVM